MSDRSWIKEESFEWLISRGLRSSGTWRGVGWYLVIDVSEQHIRPICKEQAVQEERMADNLFPDIGNKEELFFLRGLTFEYWIDI